MLNREKFLNGLGLAKRAGKCVVGDDLLPAIQAGKIKIVVLADDASERTRKQIIDKSKTNGSEVVEGFSAAEISAAIGMHNRVAVGINDRGFVKLLKANL